MNAHDTPTTRRQADLLAQGKAFKTDDERREFIAQVSREHGRFAASLLRSDLADWHRAKKGGKS